MTNAQDKAIKELNEMVNKLLYTAKYTINEFSWKELQNKEIEVYFEIRRDDNGDIVYQDGTVFITPRGKMYFINYMGNKKGFKTIQSVVSPFGYKD